MPRSSTEPVIPELGPLLGRLTEPAAAAPRGIPLDDIRLTLVTELFDLAAAARDFAREGDASSAVQSLNRQSWAAAWDRAVTAAADRIAERVDARLRSAAAESRLPAARLGKVLLSPEERRGIEVRIGVGGAALFEALDEMESQVRESSRAGDFAEVWRTALVSVARSVESAWIALEDAAVREAAAWEEDVAQVRAWRRPGWPLLALIVVVTAAAVYLGLVLGGFLPLPSLLEPFAEWWWARA